MSRQRNAIIFASLLLAASVAFPVVESVEAVLGPGLTAGFSSAIGVVGPIPTTTVADVPAMLRDLGKASGALAWKAAMRVLLTQFAQDVANLISSGGPGQSPLYETRDIGDALIGASDAALGEYVSNLTNGTLGTNLGLPPEVLRSIGLGIAPVAPTPARQSFTSLLSQLDPSDANYLGQFQQAIFSGGDLGAALSAKLGAQEAQQRALNEQTLRMQISQYRGVLRGIVKGQTATTPLQIEELAKEITRIKNLTEDTQYTGNPVADAAQVFATTLLNNMLQKIRLGLFSPSRPSSALVSQFAAGPPALEGVAASQARFADLVAPAFSQGGAHDVLRELATCPNPTNPGPNHCVIEEGFRLAADNEMTLREALERGNLKATSPVGWRADGLEPSFKEGYPYRSLIILRKYRIIPVGWELAAQIARAEEPGRIKTLKDFVDAYNTADSPYYRLVDPDWVLKAPDNFCRKKGPGPELTSDTITQGTDNNNNGSLADPEDTPPRRSVSRQEEYCADDAGCLAENADGSCKSYGYCTLERRIWKLVGQSCEPRDNSCLSFERSNGQTVSLLTNTVDFGACTQSSVGCRAYASKQVSAGVWSSAPENQLYFNQNVERCEPTAAGCREFLSFTPSGGRSVSEGLSAVLGAQTKIPNLTAYEREGSISSVFAKIDSVRDACPREAVGCDKWTALGRSNAQTTAVVEAADRCPALCAGFVTYVSDPTAFENSQSANFIARTAKACSAQESGCDEFTNLDALERGGEARETYSQLRRCRKPEVGTTQVYYSWQAAESEGGVQLVSWELERCTAGELGCGSTVEAAAGNGPNAPATVDRSGSCKSDFDKGTDFDCREFLFVPENGDRRNPERYYRRLSKVIFASEDCHPYRRTILSTRAECARESGSWTADARESNRGSCVYNAIPRQGRMCKAQAAGCRLARGPGSGDVRWVFHDDFEKITSVSCTPADSGCFSGGLRIPSGIVPGRFSLKLSSPVSVSVADLGPARRYVVQLLVRAQAEGTSLAVAFGNTQAESVSLSRDFDTVFIGPVVLPDAKFDLPLSDPESPRRLTLSPSILGSSSGTATVTIDDMLISEVPDTVAVVSGTWRTPTLCTSDTLGCWPYRSHSTQAVETLKSFGKSCAKEFIGCSELIDTGNTKSPYASQPFEVRFSVESRTLTIPADELVRVIRKKEQACTASEVGCQLMGTKVFNDQGRETIVDTAIKNDPERYGGAKPILCSENEVGCDLFTSESRGVFAFKDPGNRVCSFKLKEGQAAPGWYKEGSISTAPDCPLRSDLTYGVKAAVTQPGVDQNGKQWVGLCEATSSGCTEYVDPRSLPSRNLLTNSTLKQDVDRNGVPDGWSKTVVGERIRLSQSVSLLPNQLSVASVAADAAVTLRLSDCSRLSSPDGSFTDASGRSAFEESEVSRSLSPSAKEIISRFTFAEGSGCTVSLLVSPADIVKVRDVAVRQAMISYAIDRTTTPGECNGIVDERRGCVLFAKRSIEGGVTTEDLVSNGGFEQDENNDQLPDRWVAVTAEHLLAREIGDGKTSRALKSLPEKPVTQRVNLASATQYRVRFTGTGERVAMTLTCDATGFSSPDGSIRASSGRPLTAQDNTLLLSLDRANNTRASALVVTRTPGSCILSFTTVGVASFIDDLSIREESADGRVNRLPPLLYSVEDIPTGSPPARCDLNSQSCTAGANTVLKARPNRTCSQWLACRTAIETTDEKGKKQTSCLDIGSCAGFDSSGNCNASTLEPESTLLLNTTVSAEEARDMTGYVKVGVARGSGSAGVTRVLTEGAVPFSKAKQVGNLVAVPNPSFEEFTREGKPKHWDIEQQAATWSPNLFEVVSNPLKAQQRGVEPFEGRSYLEVHAGGYALSDLLDVFAGVPYTISGALNTVALQNGWAVVTVLQYDSDGKLLTDCAGGGGSAESCSFHTLRLARGLDWTSLVFKFVPANLKTRFLRLRITAQEFLAQKTRPAKNAIQGSIFADALTITPTLEITKTRRCVGGSTPGILCASDAECAGTAANPGRCEAQVRYLANSCRLYPKGEALSCREKDQSGVRFRGLEGYCVERDPINPAICQLWWPVDAIAGAPTGEIETFYKDRAPLYFCSEFQLLETRLGSWSPGWIEGSSWFSDGGKVGTLSCPPGYRQGTSVNQSTGGSFFFNERNRMHMTCVPSGPVKLQADGKSWYDYTPSGPDQVASCSDRCTLSGASLTREVRGFCMKLTQVVKSDGANFAWFDRTKGNYTVPFGVDSLGRITGYTYSYDSAPFGAVTIPAAGDPDSPGSWNLAKPLTLEKPGSNVARAGSPYSCATGACNSNSQVQIYPDSKTDQGVAYPTAGAESCELQGASRMKRLFLRSFGTYEWKVAGSCVAQPQEKRCSNNSPKITFLGGQKRCVALNTAFAVCTRDEDCGTVENPGHCAEKLDLADKVCEEDSECRASSEGCLPFVCENGMITCETGSCEPREAGSSVNVCKGGINSGKPCVTSCLSGAPTSQKRCSFGTTPGLACASNSDCGSSTAGRCEIRQVGGTVCSQGVRAGQACSGDGDCGSGSQQYTAVNSCGWDFPKQLCSRNIRPLEPRFENGKLTDDDYCAVAPSVGEILLNGQRGRAENPNQIEVRTRAADFVTLKFTSEVDQNQLPMTGYSVDWGDGTSTSVSGVEIRNRPNIDNPHTLFHLYSYYDILREKGTAGCTAATNDTPGSCALKVKIQIRDKWGWCNASKVKRDTGVFGFRGNDCVTNPEAWATFDGTIVVTER